PKLVSLSLQEDTEVGFCCYIFRGSYLAIAEFDVDIFWACIHGILDIDGHVAFVQVSVSISHIDSGRRGAILFLIGANSSGRSIEMAASIFEKIPFRVEIYKIRFGRGIDSTWRKSLQTRTSDITA